MNLSPREAEALRLYGAGHSAAAIAARMVISIKTVEAHLAHCRCKLRVSREQFRPVAVEAHVLAEIERRAVAS